MHSHVSINEISGVVAMAQAVKHLPDKREGLSAGAYRIVGTHLKPTGLGK